MNSDHSNSSASPMLETVPLFPLPNVVLFPHALLPLHIFEERYKAMTADALSGRRLIAMALLSPGWEKCYYGRPSIERVVCVGRIVSHERLADGKFNFLLRGELRASIEREMCCPSKPGACLYRTARLKPLPETPMMEIDLSHERQRLQAVLTEGLLARVPVVRQIAALLPGPTRTADIADLVAFHVVDDLGLKQSLLAEGDIRARVNRLLAALNSLESPMMDQLLQASLEAVDPLSN
jgi:Lon protease-like protein